MLANGLQLGWLTGDVFADLLVGFGAPLAAAGLTVALRRLRSPRWTVLPAVAVTLGALWSLDYVLIATDYRNAGGFIDCGLYCSTLQDLVAGVFWYGGLLLLLTILFSLGALAVLALRRVPHSQPPARGGGRAENEKESP